jgi:hypothetical protein
MSKTIQIDGEPLTVGPGYEVIKYHEFGRLCHFPTKHDGGPCGSVHLFGPWWWRKGPRVQGLVRKAVAK